MWERAMIFMTTFEYVNQKKNDTAEIIYAFLPLQAIAFECKRVFDGAEQALARLSVRLVLGVKHLPYIQIDLSTLSSTVLLFLCR